MLTLDATLATAQDSASRHPLVEIKSSSTTPDIPFDGRFFTGDTSANEFQPFVMNHSSGITILMYVTSTRLMLAYTDTSGNQFTTVELPLESNCSGVSCCEMADGNIGVTYLSGAYSLHYRVVTPYGVPVANGTIASWAAGLTTSHTWVVRDTVSGTYSLFYAKFVSPNWDIYKRTSSDFLTWSAESAVTPSGLTRTSKIFSPSICIMDNGDWWLWLDYVTLTSGGYQVSNLYRSISANQGSTWGAAVAITSNADISETYKHPVAIQKTATDLFMVYTKEQPLLQMALTGEGALIISGYNPTTNKLYVICRASIKFIEIDVTTWAITKTWDHASVPAVASVIASISGMMSTEYNYTGCARYHVMSYDKYIDVLDVETDTIKHFYFTDSVPFSVTANVTWAGLPQDVRSGVPVVGNAKSIYLDEVNSRLYVLMRGDYSNNYIGYFDLTTPGPSYVYTVVINDTAISSGLATRLFTVSAAEDLVFFGVDKLLAIYNLSSGAIYKKYAGGGVDASFPWHGPLEAFYFSAGIAYMGFTYQSLYGEVDRRGLLRIDIATDEMTYIRPTYSSIDDYRIKDIVQGAGSSLLITTLDGMAIYDTADFSWRLINDAALPQLPGDSFIEKAAYDPLTETIYAINTNTYVVGIPWNGVFKSSNYSAGVYSGGVWTFTPQGKLVQGTSDYDAVSALNPASSSITMTFWESKATSGQLRLKWDTDAPAYDLTPYIATGDEVAIERGITGAPNTLGFTCSHGHLFDPHNKASLLCDVLKKGRRLVVRWGEKIAGVDYWHNAGTFYVTENRVSYERGVYSDIKVSAEDMRVIWQDKHVYATDYYNASYPETVLGDILVKNTPLLVGDISIPNMDSRTILEHQWIDTDLPEIVEQITSRFGCFGKITVDDTFTTGTISETAAVTHVYPDHSKIIRFEPDDRYSDFTNRVTVQGTSKDYISVTYDEERVGSLNGTVGWWGYHKNFDVYYSDDKSRTCINPRLAVIETATSIGFALSGKITESITFEDDDNHYCTVTVNAPDLTALLVSAFAGLVATYYIPDIVPGSAVTKRVGSAMTAIQTFVIMQIIAAMGNYQYEVWAQPVGRIRRAVQSTSDDTLHQSDMGMVVEKKLEDPLAYSPSDCAQVANFELMVSRLQRNRVKIRKIAHLQDEEGDTIQIRHPYTSAVMTILIVKLTRTYKKAQGANTDGYFLDEIEGWSI